jgi:hypothetical protein
VTEQPEYVPPRHERIAAGMHTHIAEAVKWVMEPELIAVEAEVERRVRAKVIEEIEALRDGVSGRHKPYNQAFVHALDCAIRHIARGDSR